MRAPLQPGFSLIEIVIILPFFAVLGSIVLSMFLSTGIERARHRAITGIEQSGIQLLQVLTRRVRMGERILDPPRGATGSVLALQFAQGDQDPTVFHTESGKVLIIMRDGETTLLGSGALISSFVIRNTSVSSSRQSVALSFTLSQGIGFPGEQPLSRHFETSISLFPDDVLSGGGCGVPACVGGVYRWEVRDEGACVQATSTFGC